MRVGVTELGSNVEFQVTDDGPGIPEEYRERIFKMFETLVPRDKLEGSGLGLALVRRTVESVGGRVTVEPAENRGSTFRFTWPKQWPHEEESDGGKNG